MGMDIFWFDDEMSRQAQTVRERTIIIIIISSDTIDMMESDYIIISRSAGLPENRRQKTLFTSTCSIYVSCGLLYLFRSEYMHHLVHGPAL